MTAIKNNIITVTIFGVLLTGAGLGAAKATSAGVATHAIEQTDPISGLRWQRVQDPHNPSAPPRLALVLRGDSVTGGSRPTAICVHAGDQVLLQSGSSRSAEISLKATALASGSAGDRVRARVAATGSIVEMTVIGPGAGTIAAKAGAW